MKYNRLFAAVLAVLCTALLLSALCVSAEETAWSVEPGDRENILSGAAGTLRTVLADYPADLLTDGKHYGYGTDPYVFLNRRCYADGNAAAAAEQNPGTFSFRLADGETRSYYYTVVFDGLYADVNSFELYFCGDDALADAVSHFPNYQIDAAFDILISTDDGETWEVAWESERLAVSAEDSAAITGMAGFTAEEGTGNAAEVKVPDPDDASKIRTTYRIISGEFAQEYQNVTDIAYGCVTLRRSGKIVDVMDGEVLVESHCVPKTDAWYYSARMSEFQVFGEKNERPVTTEAVTTAEVTAAPVSDTEPVTSAAVTTEAPESTAVPQTSAEAETRTPETESLPGITLPAPETSGCGAVTGAGIAGILTLLGTAVLRRKH